MTLFAERFGRLDGGLFGGVEVEVEVWVIDLLA
jgi:hypothetical protein